MLGRRGPCKDILADGIPKLFRVVSPSRMALKCPFCYRKCVWYDEVWERYLKERERR